MDEFSEDQHFVSQQSAAEMALAQLKKDLEGYRQLMLPINRVLEWDQKYYPAILMVAITLLFAIVWYLEPSVLTLFSIIGLSACMIDFAVPMLTSFLCSSTKWTIREDRQYETICIRIQNAKAHWANFKIYMSELKTEKPKMYLIVMMLMFAAVAWIGSLIDNLFLTYLLVVFIVLVPGLRKRGLLQKAKKSTVDVVARLLKGQNTKRD